MLSDSAVPLLNTQPRETGAHVHVMHTEGEFTAALVME